MSEQTHKIELVNNGYAKIDVIIQEIENLAFDVLFHIKPRTYLSNQLSMQAKKLRQTLLEVLQIAPVQSTAPASGGGDAA